MWGLPLALFFYLAAKPIIASTSLLTVILHFTLPVTSDSSPVSSVGLAVVENGGGYR